MEQQTNCHKFRFTQKVIDGLPPHDPASPSTEMEYSDQEVTGLRVMVSKTGRKAYYLRYMFRGKKQVIKIGEHGPLSVVDARRKANEYKAMVLNDNNPKLNADSKATEMPTFEDFAMKEYMPHCVAKKKSASIEESRLRLYMLPAFGKKRLDELTTQEIHKFHNEIKMTQSPATANRHLAMLHYMFNLAIQWAYLEKNPASGVSKYKENNQRQRYLSKDELRRVFEAADKMTNPVAGAYFRFLILTGLRKSEALKARWEDVDYENRRLWIAETKAGEGRFVILNQSAIDLLRSRHSTPGNPYVFNGEQAGNAFSYTSAQKAFQKLKELAGITDDLRIHDLRHSFASIAINNGASLYEVQHLLGHHNSQTTQRYAHLSEETLRQVSSNVAARVEEAQAGTHGPHGPDSMEAHAVG